MFALLHHGREEDDAGALRLAYRLTDLRHDDLARGALYVAPKAAAGAHVRRMERHGLQARQVASLDRVQSAFEEVCDALEHGGASEHKMPVARIVRIAGLVQVQQVQARLTRPEKEKGG